MYGPPQSCIICAVGENGDIDTLGKIPDRTFMVRQGCYFGDKNIPVWSDNTVHFRIYFDYGFAFTHIYGYSACEVADIDTLDEFDYIPTSALTNKGENVLSLVSSADGNELSLIKGQYVDLEFTLPKQNGKRRYFIVDAIGRIEYPFLGCPFVQTKVHDIWVLGNNILPQQDFPWGYG